MTAYTLRSALWQYSSSTTTWYFLTLPKKQTEEIKERFGAHARNWGSLPVHVTIGSTRWKTAIFPNSRAGGYLLPMKAPVRQKEKLVVGAMIAYKVEILA